jgi:L-ascorbate metabolism protein UlaG (beta-lactamase superfamily)
MYLTKIQNVYSNFILLKVINIKTMKTKFLLFTVLVLSTLSCKSASKPDTISTSKGNLVIHFIGHGSLYFEFGGKIIFIDPFSKLANYSEFPKADLVLITHSHGDHFDTTALNSIVTEKTITVLTEDCMSTGKFLKPTQLMKNGDKKIFSGIEIEAVPAYNIIAKRPDGKPFHPKGEGNGYILTFGEKRVYIGGDTENIPEMKDFGKLDVAFIPMNLPYTMTPELAAEAAKILKPAILYPYHYGNTDTNRLLELLKDEKGIEVRIRDMK